MGKKEEWETKFNGKLNREMGSIRRGSRKKVKGEGEEKSGKKRKEESSQRYSKTGRRGEMNKEEG